MISQEIGNGSNLWVRPVSAFLGLVVAGGVEGELAQELAGGGVDDADVQVLDEHDHVSSGVGSTDADVVQATGLAQGDDPAVTTNLTLDTAQAPALTVSYVLTDPFPMS